MNTVTAGSLASRLLNSSAKLWHHVREQKHNHDRHYRHQQCGIDQRHKKFLAKTHRQPLKINVAVQYLIDVSALLPCHQRGGVDLWHDGMRRESIGKQFAAFHSLPDILQNLPQVAILLPLDQQFQRVQNWQARP